MAAVQKGTTLKISFGSFAYTGYLVQSATDKYDNDNIEIIKDADGANYTKILMNPYQELQVECVILGATGSITPPTKGAAITVTTPSGTSTTFYCEAASVAHSPGATKLSLTLQKDGLTYS